MVEILYMFGSFGSGVFAVAAVLCLLVGVIGFRYDKPAVIVVSLVLGIGAGYFVSMAAWDAGIGTIYIGSCIGLLSLLVSMKVRPVKRFFLGGISIFLSVAAVAVIIINTVAGTSVTYEFQALQDGMYQPVAVSFRNNDIKEAYAEVSGFNEDDIKATISSDKQTVTIEGPAANLGQLEEFAKDLVAENLVEGVNLIEIVDYSSAWLIAVIIGAVCGICTGILTMFKPKIMQIIGTSVFAGVLGSVFAYLGLGELSPFLLAPVIAVAAFMLQRFINRKKDTDVTVEEDYAAALAADAPAV